MMMNFGSYWLIALMILSLFVFASHRGHLLSTLISLELIVLLGYMIIYFMMIMLNESYFLMFYLTFCVCEGALGLSILVSLIRTHGNNHFQSYSVLGC